MVAQREGLGEGRIGSLRLTDANCYIEQVLLYSTGNYIQYSVVNHDRKNMEMILYIYVCIAKSLGCIVEMTNIVSQLPFNKK